MSGAPMPSARDARFPFKGKARAGPTSERAFHGNLTVTGGTGVMGEQGLFQNSG